MGVKKLYGNLRPLRPLRPTMHDVKAWQQGRDLRRWVRRGHVVACPLRSSWGAGQSGTLMIMASLAETNAMDVTGGAGDRAARSKPSARSSQRRRARIRRTGIPPMVGALRLNASCLCLSVTVMVTAVTRLGGLVSWLRAPAHASKPALNETTADRIWL
jgi:hypothetical protein